MEAHVILPAGTCWGLLLTSVSVQVWGQGWQETWSGSCSTMGQPHDLRQTGLNVASIFPLYRVEQGRYLAVLF